MSGDVARRTALVLALLLLPVGCQSTTEATTTTVEAPTTTAGGEDQSPNESLPIYRIAITAPFTTDNPWALLDTDSTVWNFIVNPSDPALYTWDGPNHTFVPVLSAEADPPDPVHEGETWTVTVPLRTDMWWSDGESVDANDLVFTFDTVRRLGLGGTFLENWPVAATDDPQTDDDEFNGGLLAVDALDDWTVRLTFNFEPGIAVWPFAVGPAPIFPEHYWAPLVEGLQDASELYEISGVGAPHSGGLVISDWQPAAFWTNRAEDDYWDSGSRRVFYENGAIEYTSRSGEPKVFGGEPSGEVQADYVEGPYVSEVEYSVYVDKATALLALQRGDVDYLWAPTGLERGMAETALSDPNLEVAVNPVNGFRYLAFNMRRFPMSDLAFRLAIACRIDKDFMAHTVLGGAAIPLDTLVPPGYAYWYNEDATAPCAGLDAEQRFEEAVRILESAGWTWDVKPEWDADNRDVSPVGSGLRGPDGRLVEELELLAPGGGYDALRATYALFVEEWANELGIPVTAETTGFSIIVNQVFSPEADYDMYILGWGVSPVPSHVFEFFATKYDSTLGGFNTPGYSNPAFDELAERWDRTRDLDEARSLVKQAEAILAEEQPYVVLFTTPVVEAYRRNVEYPFTDMIGGITWFLGFPTSVHLN